MFKRFHVTPVLGVRSPLNTVVALCLFVAVLGVSTATATEFNVYVVTCGWQATSVEVAVGDQVSISATGCAYFAPAEDPTNAFTPDGVRCDGGAYQLAAEYLCNSAPPLSLVGKIGDGPCFAVGSSYSATATEAGILYLGGNDQLDLLSCIDNSGFWTANIAVVPPPVPTKPTTWGRLKVMYR